MHKLWKTDDLMKSMWLHSVSFELQSSKFLFLLFRFTILCGCQLNSHSGSGTEREQFWMLPNLDTVAAIFDWDHDTAASQTNTHTHLRDVTHKSISCVWSESPYTLSHEGKRCQRIHTQQIRFPLYRMFPNSSYATSTSWQVRSRRFSSH